MQLLLLDGVNKEPLIIGSYRIVGENGGDRMGSFIWI